MSYRKCSLPIIVALGLWAALPSLAEVPPQAPPERPPCKAAEVRAANGNCIKRKPDGPTAQAGPDTAPVQSPSGGLIPRCKPDEELREGKCVKKGMNAKD